MTFFDIFWYVFNFLSIALVVVFLCMNLTPRFNRYAVFFLTLIPFSAIALAQHYFYDVPSVFFKITAFAYYFISSIAYFKDKLRTRLFVSIVLMSFTYLVSALLITGGIACGLNPYDDIMTYIVSLPNTVGLIVLFGGFTYIRMKKHKNMILPSGQMATFIFFPLSQVIVMAAAMMIISYYGWFRDKNTGLPFLEDPTRAPMIMLCVAAVLCIISDAVLLYIMVRSSQNEKLREELRIKDYQNALNLEYYKNVENSSNEVRKIRHDLANIIQTAYEVVHSGNEVDRESAERMLDQLRTEVSDVKIEKFCLNTLVNVIASNKANECRKNDIAYDFDLNVPKFINMEEVDICKAQIYKDKKLRRRKRRNVIYQQRKRRRARLRREEKEADGRPRLRTEDSRRDRRKIRRTRGGESKRRYIHLRFRSEGINNTIIIYKKQPRHENCCGCCCVILFRLPRRGCFASLKVSRGGYHPSAKKMRGIDAGFAGRNEPQIRVP